MEDNICCLFCTYGHSYMCLSVNTGNAGAAEITKCRITQADAWQIVYWIWNRTCSVVPSKAMDEVDRFFDVVDVDPSLQYSLSRTGVVVGPRGAHAHGCDCMDCFDWAAASAEENHGFYCECYDCVHDWNCDCPVCEQRDAAKLEFEMELWMNS